KTVIFKSAQLPRLRALRDLIACVVGVSRRGIDALVPVQLVDLFQTCKNIHRQFASTPALIPDRDRFTASTTTATVSVLARTAVCVRGYEWSTLPVISLQRPRPG